MSSVVCGCDYTSDRCGSSTCSSEICSTDLCNTKKHTWKDVKVNVAVEGKVTGSELVHFRFFISKNYTACTGYRLRLELLYPCIYNIHVVLHVVLLLIRYGI